MTLHRRSVQLVAVLLAVAFTGCGANVEANLSEKSYGPVELGTRGVRTSIAISEMATISTAYVDAGGQNNGGVLNSDRLVVYNSGEVKYEFRESQHGTQSGKRFNESLGYLSPEWTNTLAALVSAVKAAPLATPVRTGHIEWFSGDDYGNVVGNPSRFSLRNRSILAGTIEVGGFANPGNDRFTANFSSVYIPTSESIELMLRMRYLLNFVRENYAPPAIPLVVN